MPSCVFEWLIWQRSICCPFTSTSTSCTKHTVTTVQARVVEVVEINGMDQIDRV